MEKDNFDKYFMDHIELMGKPCLIIHYDTETTKGKMLMLEKFYEKKIARFKRAFKNVQIISMEECILTEEVLKRFYET